jgi:hypothetical protein
MIRSPLTKNLPPIRRIAASALYGLASLLLTTLLAGCDSGPATAKVEGSVSFEGKPVTSGTIVFYPAEGRPTMGSINPSGTYKLGEEALVGSHTVTIESMQVSGAGPQPQTPRDELKGLGFGGNPVVTWNVPEEYSNKSTSMLTAKVESGKTNVIPFDLKAK